MKTILEKLAEGSSDQIDPSVSRKLKVLAKDGFTAADLKSVLDEIVRDSSASGFVIQVLDGVWREAVEREAYPSP